ncbi:MAG: hypothetical protein GX678_00150 [Actinomycetales bacterium]|nr:hypothetical protein [Actinomycetales bacterium]
MSQEQPPELPPELSQDLNSLDVVRRRVLAIGFLTIVLHGVVALIWLGVIYRNDGRTSDSVIMFVMSAVVALVSYAVTRVILGQKIWSPIWILVSLAPTVIAVLWR